MGVIGFEINGNSASAYVLHYGANSFSSYAVPISLKPFFGYALNTRVAKKFRVSHVRKLNCGPVVVSLNSGSNAGLISEGLEFKPSFDEYLKAMESAKTVRGKKHASTTQKQKAVEKGVEGNYNKKSTRVGEKIDRKDGFEGAKDDGALRADELVVYKEGSSTSSGKVRGISNKGFQNEYDGKQSNLDVKAKQRNGAKVRQAGWLKHQSHSLEWESDGCSGIKNQDQSGSGSGRISKNTVRSNLDDRGGNVIEREVSHHLYSSKMSENKVVSFRQRDYNTQGKTPSGDKIVANQKAMDRVHGRKHTESGSLMNINVQSKVKLNGSRKRFIDRGYNSDSVEVDRAAFKNLEDPDNVIKKLQFSHTVMEERIQKLAKSLNGADINLPEWMFSKMMRSARLKFCDYSITRVIIILGTLGNWRRVIQVIEWLQKRERFKSHKLRHIYTAALDALGKSRRPVEALNVFHAMQQHMSTYPDLVAYHSIAVTLGQAGYMKELFDVIDIMQSPPKKKFKTGIFENWDPRLEPDIVLNACVKRKQWEGAFWVLQQLKKQSQLPSAATYGLVMEVMFSCGKYNLVHEFFRKLQKSSLPNSLTYRVLVNTLWKEGKTDEAILAVQEMERRGIVGSASLYYDLARCLCAAGRSHEALKQIDKICKVANKPLVVTYTGLMQASLDSGNIQDGAYIFEKMKEICAPNLVTCNIMLKAYLEHGMFQEAKALFEQMSESTNHLRGNTDYKMLVIPDTYTFNTMLDACVAEKRWDYFDYVYQRMLFHGYHFNPKRHLRMILEASRAGKEGPLEITWKHLNETDRIPPAPLIKERFCLKLEKDDYVAALTCITSNPPNDLQQFSKSSWLNLFKENSHRFQKDTLTRLMNEASNIVSNISSPNPTLEYLLKSCKEIFFATISAADRDSVENVFAVDSKLIAANSR
ncbi:pentatricopeptide repeat-containing protein At1g30610, chloroplastic isoform X2 [Abrus precatorius]|uniref:Pentatricopeptide repeat-containing protein At1g30610, chloroplastic isoform X2 n=1 Tax=Abrus precatorius TaxID=3816 RepID=A0A8B8LDC5_ABRPR|nr:pentatricopeptide repeat-containing protein At1g30610, chloroplastic isoform X2 [Abrus precatorius]